MSEKKSRLRVTNPAGSILSLRRDTDAGGHSFAIFRNSDGFQNLSKDRQGWEKVAKVLGSHRCRIRNETCGGGVRFF